MTTKLVFRACDVLNRTLPPGAPALTDSEIFVRCEVCGDLALNSLFLNSKRDIVYTCPTTLKPLVILSEEAGWKGARKIGDFAIWHAGDLRFRDVSIPRPAVALREIRARATKQRRKKRA